MALAKNKTIESQVALTEALANKEGVLAQVEGFRSEQLVNDLALKREQIELDNTISDAEKERRLAQLEFDASQEKNELAKLEKQRERLDLENEIILEDLERKRELYKEGTLARVEAEQEYLTRKQEIDNQLLENNASIKDELEKIEQQKRESKQSTLDNAIKIAGEESKIGKALLIAKNALLIKDLALEIKKTISFATQAGARSTIAVAEGTAQTAKVGFPQNIPLLIGYAAQAVGIVSAIKSAVSSVGGVGSVGSTSTANTSAPSFNLVQGTDSNQIAQSIGNQTPVQAYVVGSNVTSQQELDAQRVASSSI